LFVCSQPISASLFLLIARAFIAFSVFSTGLGGHFEPDRAFYGGIFWPTFDKRATLRRIYPAE
jgi:hypothetical protein